MYVADDDDKKKANTNVSGDEAAAITSAKEAAKLFADQHPESQIFAKTAVKKENSSSKA